MRRLSSLAGLALVLAAAKTAGADATPGEAPPPDAPPSDRGAEAKAEAPAHESAIDKRASISLGGYQDSAAVSALTPTLAGGVESPTAGWGVDGRYLVDMISAASPDIVATASPRWTETRHAGALGARYKPGNFGGGVNATGSYTPDYLGLSLGGNVVLDLDEKNWTLVGGYTFGRDTVGRTGTPFAVFGRPVGFHSGTFGVTRLLGPSSVLSVVFDGIVERGDQSKPYRYVPMFAPGTADTLAAGASSDDVARLRIQARPLEQLPRERERGALTARYSLRAGAVTLRAEERLYADTWSLFASTTDVRVPIDVGSRVMVWPHARFHVQNGVSFWKRAYTATSSADLPAFRTGDRELSPLWTGGLGAGARFGLGRAASPFDYVIHVALDGYYTQFSDALYMTSRTSGLLTVAGEAKF